jgi:type II secretory pathway pseudopilin PulG
MTMVLLTAFLAIGAVAAAYAALSSDAERRASAAPPPSGQPITPPAPAPTPPAPVDETPSVPAPTDDADTPAPKAGGDDSVDDVDSGSSSSASSAGTAADTSDDTSASTSSGGTTGAADTGDDATDESYDKPEPPAVIALGADAASTFDPRDRAGGLTGDPADAIDGRRKTAWEAPVNTDGRVEIGLLVSLDKPKAIEKVRLLAGTPGFSVELYGSKLGTAPDDAPGATKYWSKLDTTVDFGTDEKLTVGGGKFRHILLWFTDQPADTKVMIPEVELLRR